MCPRPDDLSSSPKRIKSSSESLEKQQKLRDAKDAAPWDIANIDACWEFLTKSGASVENHYEFYMLVVNDRGAKESLLVLSKAGVVFDFKKERHVNLCVQIMGGSGAEKAKNFVEIYHAGASLDTHLRLYEKLINNPPYPVYFYVSLFTVPFAALRKGGFFLDTHPILYETLINNPAYAEKLGKGFGELLYPDAVLDKHPKIYEVLINNLAYADQLGKSFAALHKAGASLDAHPRLFEALIHNSAYADQLGEGFVELLNADASLDKHPKLYEALINNLAYADKLGQHFVELHNAGASLETHPMLYEALIHNPAYADQLGEGFVELHKAGASLGTHLMLYDALIHNPAYADKLGKGFVALHNAGASLEKQLMLYEALVDNPTYADQLGQGFVELYKAGISLDAHSKIYNGLVTQLEHAAFLGQVFAELYKAGVSLLDMHPKLYEALIKNPASAGILGQGLTVLYKAGVSLDTCPMIYEALIQNPADAERLGKSFVVLNQAGVSIDTYPRFYEALIHKPTLDADKLRNGFALLHNVGFSLDKHPRIYETLINGDLFDFYGPAAGFVALHNAGVLVETHPMLYEALIHNPKYAGGLGKGLAALHSAGFPVNTHPMPYHVLIINPACAYSLGAVFVELYGVGIFLDTHSALYATLIKNQINADKLSRGFAGLYKVGVPLLNIHPGIYEALINNLSIADQLAHGFAVLFKAGGCSLETFLTLKQGILSNYGNRDELIQVFCDLSNMGFSVDTHPKLYKIVLEKPGKEFDLLSRGFQALRAVGADANVYRVDLSYLFSEKIAEGETIINCLHKMQTLGISAALHMKYIKTALYFPDMAMLMLNALENLSFKVITHPFIYEKFFTGGTSLAISRYHFSKVMLKLQEYLTTYPLLNPDDKDYGVQSEQIEKMMEEVAGEDAKMTQGPLDKSAETAEMERILRKIITLDMHDIHMYYDEHFGYILTLPGEPEIYLNLLLNHTNFNHTELTKDEVDALGEKIQAVTNNFNARNMHESNFVVSKLPEAAKHALAYYVGSRTYRNINRLFRGVPQTAEANFVWVSPVSGKENLLANFLCGCLVNWASAELPKLIYDSAERQALEKLRVAYEVFDIALCKKDEPSYRQWLDRGLSENIITQEEHDLLLGQFSSLDVIYPKYDLIDRSEDLETAEAGGELAITQRRLANFSTLPTVTSLSVYKEGSPFFNNSGMTKTKFETDFSAFPVVSVREGEILIPQGTVVSYKPGPGAGFFAREVRSPGMLPHESYWSSLALTEAYQYHLSNSYKESLCEVTVDGIKVYRPNHGLAHTYRVMTYLPIVIDYFAHHAIDEEFKMFCQNLSLADIEWLKAAAAFSITGRESEVAAKDDPAAYDKLREACMKYLQAFLKRHDPKILYSRMISGHEDKQQQVQQLKELLDSRHVQKIRKDIIDIVRYMGNPGYKSTTYPAETKEECKHRHFLHHFLNVAHKLDLVRCYEVSNFQRAMAICDELSEKSPEQQIDYERMVHYAIDVNKAHGNALRTDLTKSGEYRDVCQDYTSPFGQVSTNLRQLVASTRSVPKPHLQSGSGFTDAPAQPMSPAIMGK